MRINRVPNITIIALTFLFGVIQANCGDSSSSDNHNNDGGVVERANLEIVPPPGQDIGLRPGGETTLRVRYTDVESTPIAGGQVDFALTGDGGGATLRAPHATSGADGIAEMTLTAGFDEAAFHVDVTAEGAGTIRYAVAVSNAGFGGLTTGFENLGSRDASEFGDVVVHLYMDGSCADLDPAELGPAHKERTVTGLEETARFDFLPLDASYAVGAVGHDTDGSPISWGCVDLVEGQLSEGLILHVQLPLRDLYARPVDQYVLETELLMTIDDSDTLRSGVDRWVDLGDCPNDPAEAVTDCIVAALEDPVTAPEYLDCTLQGTSGLALLVSDHRGLVTGGCRSDEDGQARVSVEKILTDALSGLTAVADLRGLGAGSIAPLESVVLHSVLELLPLAQPGTFAATHALQALRFPATPVEVLVDLTQMLLPVREVTAVQVERMPDQPTTLAVADHSLTLRMPRMILRALVEGYLGGVPGDTVLEAVQAVLAQMEPPTWYPVGDPLEACPLIDSYICNTINRTSGCVLDACQRALQALAIRLENGLTDAEHLGLDLTLANGEAPLEDQDGDLEAESIGTVLMPGLWDLTLRFVGGQQSQIPVTFVGYAPLVPFSW
jgi:hypothetical protein